MKPFLKWAGGKHRLVERIKAELPPAKRLIEPFAGSASVFLGTTYDDYVVADVNKDLISLFNAVKFDVEAVVRETVGLFVPENNVDVAYYSLRKEFNERERDTRKAALFVYLNRHCFNGLCRYNRSGLFNVPFGRYRAPVAPINDIRAFSEKSINASFISEDFRTVMSQARAGDVVYCDPPYVPLTATANFTSYAQGDFSAKDQLDLANLARDLAESGVTVVISNHATEETKRIYHGAKILEFGVQRFISRDASNRAVADELLAVFSPTEEPLAQASGM